MIYCPCLDTFTFTFQTLSNKLFKNVKIILGPVLYQHRQWARSGLNCGLLMPGWWPGCPSWTLHQQGFWGWVIGDRYHPSRREWSVAFRREWLFEENVWCWMRCYFTGVAGSPEAVSLWEWGYQVRLFSSSLLPQSSSSYSLSSLPWHFWFHLSMVSFFYLIKFPVASQAFRIL